MTTETIWGSLPKAKGLGEKKILVKTLEDGDYGATTYATGGVKVTISELEKVDFAIATPLSSTTIGFHTDIDSYSGNVFNLKLLRNVSGNTGVPTWDDSQCSGLALSGVAKIRTFIVGEARKGVD